MKSSIQALGFILAAIALWLYNADSVESSKTYLFLSHTRMDENPNIHPEAASINFDYFDLLLLGGDLANRSTFDTSTINHLDTTLRLSSPTTLLAVGNHEYSNIRLLESTINKRTFYASYHDGITFVVLDTQLDSSRISGEQLTMFQNVTDTLKESSTLVIMMHKLLWYDNPPEAIDVGENESNGYLGPCGYCIQPNNFYRDIYPALAKHAGVGKQVICLAGDLGNHASSYSYQTLHNVWFLANGMDKDEKDNEGIVFYLNNDRQLFWEFAPLNDLYYGKSES